MNCKAVFSNKAHPEYGQATIPFPIPDSEYDLTISLLEDLDIGSPVVQDCMVGKLDSPYPILNRLTSQYINVDELDFVGASFISLASAFGESSLIPLLLLPKSKPLRWVSIWLPLKRLEGFCPTEAAQFQAMASKLCLSDIKDLINLTFCCQQATVITDFSNLERVGKERSLIINGGAMPSAECDQVDGQAVALDLIQSGAGVVTPYSVVYDSDAQLFGKPVLTTNWLIPRETVPDGWFCYDMRGTDSDPAASSAQAPYPSPRRRRQVSLIPLCLLSTSNPLRWASMWFLFPSEPILGIAGRDMA